MSSRLPPLLIALLHWASLLGALALGAAPEPAPETREVGQRVPAGWSEAWLADYQARFPGRTPGSEAHAGSVPHLAQALREAGASEVRVERRESEAGPVVNVVGLVRGQRRERVVLAAHHDVVPGAPGAIDDGGGIATILAAVKALSEGPPPPCDVEVAFFDGEEWGCLGSKAHVKTSPAPIRAALAVELVGWKKDRLVVHTLPYGFAWEAPGVAPAWLPLAVQRAGATQARRVGFGDPAFSPWYQATVRVMKLRTGSDAGAYSEAGLPALMLTGSSLTNFYAGYHRPSDDMSRVDGEKLDQAARVIAASAWELGALAGPDPSLGVPSLSLGQRTAGPLGLALWGLLAACAAAYAALRAGGQRDERGAVALALALVACGLSGSLIGLLCFAPLASGAALAAGFPRARRPILVAALVPLALELILILGATLAFGFGWRGGWVETLALLLACAACGSLLRSGEEASG